MGDKRIKIINIIFLIFITIYTLYSFTFSFDVDSEGIIFGIGVRLYLIGFIIFAISQMYNEKKEYALTVFTILVTLSATATTIQGISVISHNITYAYTTLEEVLAIIFDCAQKIILSIVLFFTLKQRKNMISVYILLGITFILLIIMLYQEIMIDYCLLVVVKSYIALYVFYFNKGISKKTFRNIILIMTVEFVIILLFILSVTWLPKARYNRIAEQLEKMNSISSSNINTTTRSIGLTYNDARIISKKKINYEVSQNMDEEIHQEKYSEYCYNDNILVGLKAFPEPYEIKDNDESFIVNNREFYINSDSCWSTSTYKFVMSIHANLQNNMSCYILIMFKNKISLNEEDLQNLRPLFHINAK